MTALPQSGGFTMVDPTHVAAVGPAAALLYARIVWRAGDAGTWRATRSELSAETGLSPAMIRTAVDVLRDREWLAAQRTSTLDSTLIWRPITAGQPERLDPPSREGDICTSPPATSAIPSTETGKKNPLPPDGGLFDPQPTPPRLRSVPTSSAMDAEFARFWELYPRKTAKKAARTAYGRARRTTTVEAIAHGLRRQLPRLQQTDPQYVPHPTTWLNQGRWEDQDSAVQVPPTSAEEYAASLPPARLDPFAR